MSDIVITNKKIIDFYDKNPNLNIESVNLLVIDLIDKIVNNDSKAFDSIQSQILCNIVDLKGSIKKELETAFTNSNKIDHLFQQNASQIVDKTSILIHESLSKTDHNLQPIINATEQRLQKEIGGIKDGLMTGSLIGELTDFFNKFKNSSYKGQLGEMQLESALNQMFPSAEVANTSSLRASCDFRLTRADKNVILFETKDYDRNVTLDEVKKFIRDIELQKHHGIFLSQHSGITSKQNFQIDIIGKNVVIYIHHVKYDQTVMRLAIDIIDSLSEKLAIIDDGEKDAYSLDKDTFEAILKEYNDFVQKKLAFIDTFKDSQKRLLALIDDIKFPCLSKILTQNHGSMINNDSQKITCNICNNYDATSNKSLAAHQRGCRKKMAQKKDDTIVVDA